MKDELTKKKCKELIKMFEDKQKELLPQIEKIASQYFHCKRMAEIYKEELKKFKR